MNNKSYQCCSKTVALVTQNMCRRRYPEIEQVLRFMQQNGYQITSEPEPETPVLFFGCAFNDMNENDCLAKLTDIARENRPENIFVLGGIADLIAEENANRIGLDTNRIVPHREYQRLEQFFPHQVPYTEIKEDGGFECLHAMCDQLPGISGTAAWAVRVSSGCADNCAFCGDKRIVKHLTSRPLQEGLDEVRRGLRAGFSRIELVGDDVAAYGIDIGLSFMDLLNGLDSLGTTFELSMHELNIKYLIGHLDALREFLARSALRPELVIAFQSANDRVLELMNRGYTAAQAESLVELLESYGMAPRFHALLGFPSESETEFRQTVDFIAKHQFQSGSLFRYDDRPGTPAAPMTPKVADEEKDKRLKSAAETLTDAGYDCELRDDKLMVKRT